MGLLNVHSVRGASGLAWLSFGLLISGCRTTSPQLLPSTSGPGWQVQEGQALWRPRRGLPELAGDLVLATNTNGSHLLQFNKTPFPLVLAETSLSRWYIGFPPRHLSFSGHLPPPARFGWLYLAAALSGRPLPARFDFQRKPDGGWRLENKRSGETLEGFLEP